MYGPDVAILLMYGSHDMRHTDFRRLMVVNRTLGNWSVTHYIYKINFLLILSNFKIINNF